VKRLAALLVIPALLLAGCREDAGSAPADQPGASVQKQVDDLESTLDSIESELNAG
jgi:outer membrane murein-binding lipoprotein Lpp